MSQDTPPTRLQLKKDIHKKEKVSLAMFKTKLVTSFLRHTGVMIILDGEPKYSIDMVLTNNEDKGKLGEKTLIGISAEMCLGIAPNPTTYEDLIELHCFEVDDCQIETYVYELMMELLDWEGEYNLFNNNCRDAVQRTIDILKAKVVEELQIEIAEKKLADTRRMDKSLFTTCSPSLGVGYSLAKIKNKNN